jgi:NAD+ kinase
VSGAPRAIAVYSHTRVHETGASLRRVLELTREAGIELRLAPEEAEKHGLGTADSLVVAEDPAQGADLALALGGDGTILAVLRRFARTGVPVFAVNFGAIGFLATVEPAELEEGMPRALAGDFDVLQLPGLVAETTEGELLAVNDISFHRRQNGRVAELAYSVEGEQLGSVRCDGLVVSTPAGSTGYNLANGGPVLAWGVEGFVVSFIAPHTLTARVLVVAPGDSLSVTNRSHEDEVDMTTDGRSVWTLEPDASIRIRFAEDQVRLAQAPGATFYHRLRDKFGRLSY